MKKTLIALALTASLFAGSAMALTGTGTTTPVTLFSATAVLLNNTDDTANVSYFFSTKADADGFVTAVQAAAGNSSVSIPVKRMSRTDFHVPLNDVLAATGSAAPSTTGLTVAAVATFLETMPNNVPGIAFEKEGRTSASASASAFLAKVGLSNDKATPASKGDDHLAMTLIATSKD